MAMIFARMFTAANAQDGFKLLELHADEIGLLLTVKPAECPVKKASGCSNAPGSYCVRASCGHSCHGLFADFDAAIAAVNSGAILRKYINKPWDPPQLELALRQALEFFLVQSERDQLLHEKMSVLHNMMIADRIVSLGLLAMPALSCTSHQKLDGGRENFSGNGTDENVRGEGQFQQPARPGISGATTIRTPRARLKKSTPSSATCGLRPDSNAATQFADKVKLHEAVGAAALEMFKEQFAARRESKSKNKISRFTSRIACGQIEVLPAV